jgi:hypothetical protein
MATPGNFGGGGIGPDQIFLGITRAQASAPGRGRAQSPVRQKPNPQTACLVRTAYRICLVPCGTAWHSGAPGVLRRGVCAPLGELNHAHHT